MNENPFYIVGFMGTGKSTLFSFLKEYGEVIDLDLVIESMTGMEIATYFDRNGESAFRDVESKVLQQVTADYILTGGGVVERSENICWMRERGTMIHLNLPFDMCWNESKILRGHLLKEDGRMFMRCFNDVINYIEKRVYPSMHLNRLKTSPSKSSV
ncbi:shikimate kinase [Exiguobacterium profundum]|uniref:shikimate kinase n=1 Tax=Exiguobacterium profundum TaxID=307643 RepID=UPI003515C1F5